VFRVRDSSGKPGAILSEAEGSARTWSGPAYRQAGSPTARTWRRNAPIMNRYEIASGWKIQYLLAINRTVIFYAVIKLYGVPRWIDRHGVEALSV